MTKNNDYTMYVDGGGQFKNTYFSFIVYGHQSTKPLHHMNRFLLRNLSPELLPKSCSIVDDKNQETNNIAEYAALHYGILWFVENVGPKEINIYHDSQLVVRQVSGQYQCRKQHLKSWLAAIKMNKWRGLALIHVPREIIVKKLGH